MPDPPSCMSGCPSTFPCNMELGECIHKSISLTGTEITRLSSSLTTVDRTRVSGVGAVAAELLPGGRRLVYASISGGVWLLTPDGKRDLNFGDEGLLFGTSGVPLAVAGRADAGFVVVTSSFNKTSIWELTSSGKLVTTFESPSDIELTALRIPDDATLLAAGEREDTIVVVRYIRTVP
jgi:hypothetical protein